jgi:hypothetical protein
LGIDVEITRIPLGIVNWSEIEIQEYKGETGLAFWRVAVLNNMRIRCVEYTPGYLADHWCVKGHVVFCIEGELLAEHKGAPNLVIKAGASYVVSDDAEPHRWSTVGGAKVFILD